MSYQLHDTVVLTRDQPGADLKQGDLGAVVMVYDGEACEVEFVRADGHTRALLTLRNTDIRPLGPSDAIAVRPLNRSA